MTMSTHAPIIVERATTSAAHTAGMAFLINHYTAAFNVIPSSPDHLFVAWLGAQVVGTFGVTLPEQDGQLSIQKRYDYPVTAVPENAMQSAVEFGRWSSASPPASRLLIRAALTFSDALKKQFAWCEQGTTVHRFCTKMGLSLKPVPDATCIPDTIPLAHQAYYNNERPSLYILDIRTTMAQHW